MTAALVLFGSGLMSVSCIDGIFGPPDPGINRGPNGEDNRGTHGPGTGPGTGSGEDQNKSVFPGDKTYTLKADAVYYGDSNYEGVSEFVLYLYWGEYDEDGSFISEGTELAFDILCSPSSDMKLASGTYGCTSSVFTPGHFLDGYEENGQIYPSFAYYQMNKQKSKAVKITAGSIQISSSDKGYSLRVNFQAEGPYSTTSYSYLVLYDGIIEVVDGRENGGSDTPKFVEMNKFSRVEAEYWGQIWTDKDGRALPVSDWILYLHGENADEDNEYTMIELLTPADSKKLEPGIYNEVITLDDTKLFQPGAVIAGYSEAETNIAYGTWYCKDGSAIFAATKGQVTVAAKDDLYSLNFDFTDEDETYGGQFKGTYTGGIEFIDCTVDTKSGESRGRLQKKIQRNSTPSRNVKAARRIFE